MCRELLKFARLISLPAQTDSRVMFAAGPYRQQMTKDCGGVVAARASGGPEDAEVLKECLFLRRM